MQEEICIGIVGTGIIGKSHINKYKEIPGVKVLAIADIDEGEAQRVAAAQSIPHVFTDFRRILEMPAVQAVDVCVHNNKHAPISIAAMEAGKHVYCEKPIAGAYHDGRAMVETARRTGRMLHIQLSTLYSKEHKAAKKMVSEGLLGKVYYARSFGFRRRGRVYVDGYATPPFVQKVESGGGALFDMGIYHMAQVLDLLQNPAVETITGTTYQEVPMYEKQARDSGFNVEELGLGFARLAGGITLAIEESWALHYDDSESSKILGSRGGIKLNPLTYFSTAADVEYNALVDVNGPDRRWHRWVPEYDAYDSSQHHWIAALRGRVPLLPTAELALNVALISEGIYMSQRAGREVTAAEVVAESTSTALAV